jgi:hypothetical protein
MVKSDTNIVGEPDCVEPKNTQHVEKEAWVAVLYASKWYIGQVREIDEDDGEVFITFMTACGKYGNCFSFSTCCVFFGSTQSGSPTILVSLFTILCSVYPSQVVVETLDLHLSQ